MQSSRGEVAGPLGDEHRAGREGACRAAQSVLERGGGEAPGASMSQLNIYTYTVVLAALPDSGAPGRPGFTLVGQRTGVGALRTL